MMPDISFLAVIYVTALEHAAHNDVSSFLHDNLELTQPGLWNGVQRKGWQSRSGERYSAKYNAVRVTAGGWTDLKLGGQSGGLPRKGRK